MLSLESPQRVHTIYHFQHKKRKLPKITVNLQGWDFFQGTQEQVQNSHDKRAISVRASEVLLYYGYLRSFFAVTSKQFHHDCNTYKHRDQTGQPYNTSSRTTVS